MKKSIFILLISLLMTGMCKGQAIPVARAGSSLPVGALDNSVYVFGIADSAGVPKTRKFKLPFTYHTGDTSFNVPALAGRNGMLMIDSAGNVTNGSYLTAYNRAIDTSTDVANFGLTPGAVDIVAGYKRNAMTRTLNIYANIQVNDAGSLAMPPARTRYALFTKVGVPPADFSVPVVPTSGSDAAALLQIDGGLGYFSTVDFRWSFDFVFVRSTLYVYLLRPASPVTDYTVNFALAMPY